MLFCQFYFDAYDYTKSLVVRVSFQTIQPVKNLLKFMKVDYSTNAFDKNNFCFYKIINLDE